MSRATILRSAATESSRSRIRPSAPDCGPLASLRSESAGTNRKERMLRLSLLGAFAHQRLAGALGDVLAALIEGGMAKLDDASIGPRLAFPHRDDLGLDLERVAVEDGLGEAHIGHAKIGDGRAERRVVDGNANHEAECE